jgi:hypothetical protein
VEHRLLPENLTYPQLVKKFPAFYGTRRFITAFTTTRHLSRQINQVHAPHPTPLTSPVPLQLLVSNQRISPRLRPCKMFSNTVKFLRVVSTSSNPIAVGPPFVRYPRLIIQYIRNYPPYLEAVLPSATWGRTMPWWQGPAYQAMLQ